MKNRLKIVIPVIIAAAAIITAALCINFTPEEKTDFDSLLSTAQKYLIENHYEQAIAEFEKIIELDPMNVEAYLGIAKAYEALGDTKKAVEWLEKGYELTGDRRLFDMLNRLNAAEKITEEKNIEYDIPAEAIVFNGHSYFVFSDICPTWEEARDYCNSLGGHLAVINNEAENQAVYDILRMFGYESAYFGYSDKEEDGTWIWVDGEDSDYVNWHIYEPSDGFYAMYYWKWEYEWNDGTFDEMTDNGGREFICEWETAGAECMDLSEYQTRSDEPVPDEIYDSEALEDVLKMLINDPNADVEQDKLNAIHTVIINGERFAVNRSYYDKYGSTSYHVGSISDISFVSRLKNITILELTSNEIIDISSLSELTHLTYLRLDDNQIRDINPLSGLTDLTYLWIHQNQINDLSPLAGLTNLMYLDMCNNQISDLSPLSKLINLTELHMDNNPVSDISSLSGLISMTTLSMSSVQISDISPLSNLANLKDLYLDLKVIRDASKADDLRHLSEALPNCDIHSYDPDS